MRRLDDNKRVLPGLGFTRWGFGSCAAVHAGLDAEGCLEFVEDLRHCLCCSGKMAEAAAVPPHRFFCHCCKGEVNPKLPVSPTIFACVSIYCSARMTDKTALR